MAHSITAIGGGKLLLGAGCWRALHYPSDRSIAVALSGCPGATSRTALSASGDVNRAGPFASDESARDRTILEDPRARPPYPDCVLTEMTPGLSDSEHLRAATLSGETVEAALRRHGRSSVPGLRLSSMKGVAHRAGEIHEDTPQAGLQTRTPLRISCLAICTGRLDRMGGDPAEPVNPLKKRFRTGKALSICDQGAFFVGGVPKVPSFGEPRQTIIGQMYTQFQIPTKRRQWPIIFVQGQVTWTGVERV